MRVVVGALEPLPQGFDGGGVDLRDSLLGDAEAFSDGFHCEFFVVVGVEDDLGVGAEAADAAAESLAEFLVFEVVGGRRGLEDVVEGGFVGVRGVEAELADAVLSASRGEAGFFDPVVDCAADEIVGVGCELAIPIGAVTVERVIESVESRGGEFVEGVFFGFAFLGIIGGDGLDEGEVVEYEFLCGFGPQVSVDSAEVFPGFFELVGGEGRACPVHTLFRLVLGRFCNTASKSTASCATAS